MKDSLSSCCLDEGVTVKWGPVRKSAVESAQAGLSQSQTSVPRLPRMRFQRLVSQVCESGPVCQTLPRFSSIISFKLDNESWRKM